MIFHNLRLYKKLPSPLAIPFSGGRSSGYQLAHIIEANGGLPAESVVVFQNTGFERPETYDFIEEFSRWSGVPITWLERATDEATKVKVVNHNSAERRGRKAPLFRMFTEPLTRKDGSYGLRPLPNPVQRTCSAELKTKTSHRYVRQHLGWPNAYWTALGYRADEPGRVVRRRRQERRYGKNSCPEGGWATLPMFHAGVESADVAEFWAAMPFDLGIESHLGNCDLCFMKAEWKLKEMMEMDPEAAELWIEMEATERDRSNRFRKDRRSVQEIWDEVQAGDMSAQPQDPFMECGSCTGDLVDMMEADQ